MVSATNLIVFAYPFLMAGPVFGELYVLQAHKILAGTAICEVWKFPSCIILLQSALESCFLVMFVSIRSIVFCVSHFVCVLQV